MGEAAEPRRRNATRGDVARLAGVSTAVVSYVVNNGPRPVAPATRQRVLDAIEKLGYQPNAAARSLITGQANLLGLVVPDVRNPYFAAVAQEVEAAARERGLTLLLVQSEDASLTEAVDALGGQLVAGVITASGPTPDALRQLVRQHARLVGFSLVTGAGPFPCLAPNFYEGASAGVRHLVEVHGHTRVGLITGSAVREDRERAWHDTLVAAGLEPAVVIRRSWSMAGGRAAAGALFAEHPEVTAVFVASDQQATGVLSGVDLAGRRVPDDLAVVAFDGSPESEFTIPPLTTVKVPMTDMARDAVALALGEAQQSVSVYPTTLTVRQSCGC